MELILWISQQTVQKTLQKHDMKRDEAKTELSWNTIKQDSRYFVHLGMDKYSWGQLEALFSI